MVVASEEEEWAESGVWGDMSRHSKDKLAPRSQIKSGQKHKTNRKFKRKRNDVPSVGSYVNVATRPASFRKLQNRQKKAPASSTRKKKDCKKK